MSKHPIESALHEESPEQPLGVLAVDPDGKIFDPVRDLVRDLDGWTYLAGLSDWTEAAVAAREQEAAAVFVNLDAGLEEAMATAADVSSSLSSSVLLGVSEEDTGDWLIRGVRAGFRDFLRFPLDPSEAVAALSRIRHAKSGRRRGQVITLFSPKGGSGLTTLTVNLAILLALEQKKKVGVIDMDLEFGDVPFFLNLSPTATLGDVADRTDLPTRNALLEALVPHASGIEVLAAPKDIQQAEKVSEETVGQVIREMQDLFDFVLINTDSSFSPATLRSLDLSQTILLLTLPHLAAIGHARRTLEVFKSLGYEKKVRLVVNRYNPAEDEVPPEEIGKTVGLPVLKSLPSDYRTVIHAINRGLSLWESAPRSPVTRAMVALARDLTGGEAATNGNKPKKKKGLFRFH